MTDANARLRPPDEEVVRTRRIEVLDDSDRIRVVIGQQAEPGTHEIRGFGITLRGANGSVRADLIEDASGARLAFLSSGNNALEVGAEDANTLMLDRGGDDLTYLPAGSPGNEVMRAGPYIIFDDAEGAEVFGWRVEPDGSVELIGADDEDAAERTGAAAGTGAAGGPSPGTPASTDASEGHCSQAEGCAVCVLAEHFLNTLVRAASKGH